jgi:hypothetical protein
MKRVASRAGAMRTRAPPAQAAPPLRWEGLPAIALLMYAVAWFALIAGFVAG